MCKNYDVDVPNSYPTVEPSSDYSEVTSYDRDDAKDYSDYYDIPKDLFETIGQAINDAIENEERNEEGSAYSASTESSDGGDDDDD